MENEKVFAMKLAKVYPLLVNKAERKGRTKDEVDEIIFWLMGYTQDDIASALEKDVTYGDFFNNSPSFNPNSTLIKGKICGVKVEEITDPLMQRIRYLDKLVDELAKGKTMDKILRK